MKCEFFFLKKRLFYTANITRINFSKNFFVYYPLWSVFILPYHCVSELLLYLTQSVQFQTLGPSHIFPHFLQNTKLLSTKQCIFIYKNNIRKVHVWSKMSDGLGQCFVVITTPGVHLHLHPSCLVTAHLPVNCLEYSSVVYWQNIPIISKLAK